MSLESNCPVCAKVTNSSITNENEEVCQICGAVKGIYESSIPARPDWRWNKRLGSVMSEKIRADNRTK